MKKLIVTRADENIAEMVSITHPLLKKYAEKCDADFSIFKNDVDYHPHYKILQIHDLLKEYDRVACIGTDTIVRNNCPDIFNEVPIHKIGSILEDIGTRKADRRNRMLKIQSERGDINWREGYINTDVSVFSKMHRDIFINENLYLDLGYDDVFFGYTINKLGYEIHELDYRWDHMSMHSEPWNNYASRFDSYIMHYAGQGFYSIWTKTEQIKMDYGILKKYGLA